MLCSCVWKPLTKWLEASSRAYKMRPVCQINVFDIFHGGFLMAWDVYLNASMGMRVRISIKKIICCRSCDIVYACFLQILFLCTFSYFFWFGCSCKYQTERNTPNVLHLKFASLNRHMVWGWEIRKATMISISRSYAYWCINSHTQKRYWANVTLIFNQRIPFSHASHIQTELRAFFQAFFVTSKHIIMNGKLAKNLHIHFRECKHRMLHICDVAILFCLPSCIERIANCFPVGGWRLEYLPFHFPLLKSNLKLLPLCDSLSLFHSSNVCLQNFSCRYFFLHSINSFVFFHVLLCRAFINDSRCWVLFNVWKFIELRLHIPTEGKKMSWSTYLFDSMHIDTMQWISKEFLSKWNKFGELNGFP